ncbi:MFS transporter [Pontibacillus sp. HMF3514]|uniref:MFS transporter n=1 Tax=Pontibacillus sp. HMF3514 TaxID=2692425 RepID=UPI00131FAA0F|nr:MFS transporter [Pontibacillus sp. HMF3514]QHE51956.1 MFS transporter [Pontibacillus sp. HMF3514]
MSDGQEIDKEIEIPNSRGLLFALCAVLMFSVMNGTMFNIAVPDIAKTYDLLPSEVSWVMTGYIMVYAVGALMYGKLADFYPYKTLITIGLTIFSVGSIVGFFSVNYGMVLVARIIQAMGGSMIPALVFLAPIRYFPKERGKVLGIVSSVMAFASGIGPIAGGFIAGTLTWRYLFLTSALIIITLPLLRKNLPEESTNKGYVDYLGAAVIGGFIASLLLGITLGNVWVLCVSAMFFILFILRTRSIEKPFIPPHLFKNIKYRTTIITSFFTITCLFGMMFLLPIMLRDVYGLSTMSIGFVLFPGAMSAALVGQKGGTLVDLKGAKFVLYGAMLLLGTGFLAVSSVSGLAVWLLSGMVIISYMSFPLVQASSAELLSSLLSKNETGVGMGVFNLMNFVSGAISATIIGKVLDLFDPSFSINPIAMGGASSIYSNIFLAFSMIILIGYLQFRFFFHKEG